MAFLDFKIQILSLLLMGAFAIPQSSWGQDEDPQASAHMITVPPLELQNGGKEIFDSLGPPIDKVYLNQKLDLELIGPGTNIVFVTDLTGEVSGLAFSNGRFEVFASNGSIKDRTFPNEFPTEHKGKYPWPRDAKGRYLPGDKLKQSNGPHAGIRRVIRKANPHSLKEPLIAGHVGVDMNGKVYIGYISASVNGSSELKKQKDSISKEVYRSDVRALPPQYREALHQSIKKFFFGRNLSEVLRKAPTTPREIIDSGAVQNFPFDRRVPRLSEMSTTPIEALLNTLGEKKTLDYISQLEIKQRVLMMIDFISGDVTNLSPDVKERMIHGLGGETQFKDSLSQLILKSGRLFVKKLAGEVFFQDWFSESYREPVELFAKETSSSEFRSIFDSGEVPANLWVAEILRSQISEYIHSSSTNRLLRLAKELFPKKWATKHFQSELLMLVSRLDDRGLKILTVTLFLSKIELSEHPEFFEKVFLKVSESSGQMTNRSYRNYFSRNPEYKTLFPQAFEAFQEKSEPKGIQIESSAESCPRVFGQ